MTEFRDFIIMGSIAVGTAAIVALVVWVSP